MNNLLPPLSSYLPMSPSEIDRQYIPTDPLYLPCYRPEQPFCLGDNISRTGAGTRYIGITAQDPTLAYISLCQDTTSSHYSQPFPPDDIIDPEMHNVLKRCTRVGRVAWLLWKEIIYCSRLALLNDDDDDKEETFGEYVQSTKQLKKIRRRIEMPKKKDSIKMTAEMLFPLDMDGYFLDSFPYDSTDVLL